MKSSVNILADYRQAPLKREVTVECPPEYMERMLKRLTRDRKKTANAATVQKGDIVCLNLESTLHDFNGRGVFVTVGSGLFDDETESALIGKSAGSVLTVKKDNSDVKCEIISAKRQIYPEPSDADAKAYADKHNLKNIDSLSSYIDAVRGQYIKEEKERIIQETESGLIEYVLTNSDWNFDEEEIAELADSEKKYIEEELASENKTPGDLTKAELKAYYGVDSLSALYSMIRSSSEWQIAQILWLCSEKQINTKDINIDKFEDYDFDFLSDFVKDSIVFIEK